MWLARQRLEAILSIIRNSYHNERRRKRIRMSQSTSHSHRCSRKALSRPNMAKHKNVRKSGAFQQQRSLSIHSVSHWIRQLTASHLVMPNEHLVASSNLAVGFSLSSDTGVDHRKREETTIVACFSRFAFTQLHYNTSGLLATLTEVHGHRGFL